MTGELFRFVFSEEIRYFLAVNKNWYVSWTLAFAERCQPPGRSYEPHQQFQDL